MSLCQVRAFGTQVIFKHNNAMVLSAAVSSGLPPYEARVMIAEKRKLFFFLFYFQQLQIFRALQGCLVGRCAEGQEAEVALSRRTLCRRAICHNCCQV